MYRSLSIFVLSIFLLVGCQTDKDTSSTTPEAALDQIHSKEAYAKPSEIYEVIEIEEGRVLAVYKGKMNDAEEIYVANIESDDGKWLVTDAINIGMPSAENLNQSSLTESFEAGYTTNEISSGGNIRIVKFKDSDYNVWIEVFK
jgi:hypothetical protein